ncbi:MAG: hypothetical protein ACTH2Q_18565 [Propionibacteriaceae bacterium]
MIDNTHPPTQSPEQRLASVRMIAFAMAATPVFLGVALFMVFDSEELFAAPATWLVVAQLVAAVAIFVLCQTRFSRPAAIPRGTEETAANDLALTGFQSTFFLRVAVCETLPMFSAAAAFVVLPTSWLSYAVGAFLGLVLLAVHVIPNERTTSRIKEALEREGARVTVF